MKQNHHVFQFVDSLVASYAKYDKLSNQYILSTKSIPDFDLHELASLLIQEDTELAKEATSVDNPNYEQRMLPALIKHMQESTNKTLRNDFDEAWLEGITKYLDKSMQAIIDDQCIERLISENKSKDFYPITNRKTNEIEWRI